MAKRKTFITWSPSLPRSRRLRSPPTLRRGSRFLKPIFAAGFCLLFGALCYFFFLMFVVFGAPFLRFCPLFICFLFSFYSFFPLFIRFCAFFVHFLFISCPLFVHFVFVFESFFVIFFAFGHMLPTFFESAGALFLSQVGSIFFIFGSSFFHVSTIFDPIFGHI